MGKGFREMKIEIEIPDPKFKVGDFLRYTEKEGLSGFLVIGRVQVLLFHGSWGYCGRHKKPAIAVDEARYSLVVQEGSLTTKKTVLRPGMIQWCLFSDIDTYAEKIEYTGKVWEGDTIYNIGERI